ncbi:MAG: hypothetical protein ACTSQ5_01095 [Promethearchaeota archaeon]
MKNKNYGISFAMVFIICFSFFTPVLAADYVWPVEEGDSLLYTINSTEGEKTLAKGTCKIIIDKITAGTPTITVDTDLTGEDSIDYRDAMETEEKDILFSYISIAHLGSIIYSEDYWGNVATNWDNMLDLYELISTIINSTFTRDISETHYEYRWINNITNTEGYGYAKYTEDGILLKSIFYDIDSDGIKTEIVVEKQFLPYFTNLYLYGGAGAVVLLIVIISICAKKKK